jgi:hypothetical protein
MNDNPKTPPINSESGDANARLERRVLCVMAVAGAFAVLISPAFASWRITTGLLLGSVLSLLNFHWMRNSIAAAFSKAEEAGARPKIRLAQYVLRYFIIGAMVYLGYKLNFVSLAATVIGLSSFVVALFVEALRESYFIIIHREGIN